ncbi:hypothetical protein ACFQ0M_25305 [Kitasatospora aburaviensis]
MESRSSSPAGGASSSAKTSAISCSPGQTSSSRRVQVLAAAAQRPRGRGGPSSAESVECGSPSSSSSRWTARSELARSGWLRPRRQ